VTEPSILAVFAAALVTALATGLGALPLLAAREIGARWLAFGNAVAAGLMLAACYTLIDEGFAFSPERTMLGVLLGLAGIVAANRMIGHHSNLAFAGVGAADVRKLVMIVGVMTVHSAAEGIGVGVAYGGTDELGAFITLAIALHNVPEGLAISLVLVPRGVSVARAASWSIFSSLPQPVLAVPAFLFVLGFAPWLPVGLGVAAGAMLWMVFSELLPDATEGAEHATVGLVVTLAFLAMLGATTVI
jgi:zinc transporter, ZIP family